MIKQSIESEIIIVDPQNLSHEFKEMDREITKDAFSYLLDLSKDEKKEINEKYKSFPWKYLFIKGNDYFVGRVVLDKREVQLEKRLVLGVGIGGLAVKSNFQKHGIGSSLMNSSIEFCKKNKIDFMFLNAGNELQDYYKEFGFQLHEYRFNGASGKEYIEDEGMVLVLNKSIENDLLNFAFSIGIGNV